MLNENFQLYKVTIENCKWWALPIKFAINKIGNYKMLNKYYGFNIFGKRILWGKFDRVENGDICDAFIYENGIYDEFYPKKSLGHIYIKIKKTNIYIGNFTLNETQLFGRFRHLQTREIKNDR